jgi:hypothetical protein
MQVNVNVKMKHANRTRGGWTEHMITVIILTCSIFTSPTVGSFSQIFKVVILLILFHFNLCDLNFIMSEGRDLELCLFYTPSEVKQKMQFFFECHNLFILMNVTSFTALV